MVTFSGTRHSRVLDEFMGCQRVENATILSLNGVIVLLFFEENMSGGFGVQRVNVIPLLMDDNVICYHVTL